MSKTEAKFRPKYSVLIQTIAGTKYLRCELCRELKRLYAFSRDSSGRLPHTCNKCRANSAPNVPNLSHKIAKLQRRYGLELPTHCPYLGIELQYRPGHGQGSGRADYNLATVDRIDSTKGYEKGNVQIISYLANCMKRDATIEQLIAFAHGVIKTHG